MSTKIILALMFGMLVFPACQQDEPPTTENTPQDSQDEQPVSAESATQDDQGEPPPATERTGQEGNEQLPTTESTEQADKEAALLGVATISSLEIGGELNIRGTPPYTPLTTCVADYLRLEPRVFRALMEIPATMVLGEKGTGSVGNPRLFVEALSRLTLDTNGEVEEVYNNRMPFRKGELIVLKGTEDALNHGEDLNEVQKTDFGEINLLHIPLRSLLKHNITRGTGAFQHQSAEKLKTTLTLPLQMSCQTFKRVWEKMFERVGYEEVGRVMNSYPSGVLVDEIRAGMTPTEVAAMFGAPERRASIGEKMIDFYPRMKITFTDGKVTNIE